MTSTLTSEAQKLTQVGFRVQKINLYRHRFSPLKHNDLMAQNMEEIHLQVAMVYTMGHVGNFCLKCRSERAFLKSDFELEM